LSDSFEQQEYFTLVNTVTEFDRRLLTIKGWGVTLSLAAVGLGFQYKSYGFFLLAAASSLAFWSIEAVIKRHQIRYYPRIREIEVNRFESAFKQDKERTSPRIDWGWDQAGAIFKGEKARTSKIIRPRENSTFYKWGWLSIHVAFPHAITFFLGTVLFLLAISGHLPDFAFGAFSKP
jgi:hypothetical protein